MVLETFRRYCFWRLLPAALLLTPVTLSTAHGADTTNSGFHDVVRRMAEARARISSYDVTITGKVDSRVERVEDTSGKIHEIEKVPTGFTLNVVFDREQSKLFVARKNVCRVKATGQTESSDWQVYGRAIEDLPEGERWTTSKGRYLGDPIEFFDPLGFGLCFGVEFRRGDPWGTIVANYLQWPDNFRTRELSDGKVRFERDDFSIEVDTQHDHWPIKTALRSGGGVLFFASELALSPVHGHWLPESGRMALPQETTDLHFDWHSVNQPISQERLWGKHIFNSEKGMTQTLAGIVVDPDGKPVAGATVSARLSDGTSLSRSGSAPPPWVETGKDGLFYLIQLPEQPLQLMAYIAPKGPDRRIRFPVRVVCELNQQDIRIVLDPSLIDDN